MPLTKPKSKKSKKKKVLWAVAIWNLILLGIFCPIVYANEITINAASDATGNMGAIQLLFLFVLLSIGPSLLIMMTSFTRIVIVFSFLRSAIGLQGTPPNQVMVGLALFLSMFIMQPTLSQVNENGLQPYLNGEITQEQALEQMEIPMKEFMMKQTKPDDLNMFASLAQKNGSYADVTDPSQFGLDVVVPAFITSELSRAFMMGFLLFLPFLVIDMIVSSTLMSMGMVMLPPSMISLPFKLLLFVVVDGWSLLIQTLVASF